MTVFFEWLTTPTNFPTRVSYFLFAYNPVTHPFTPSNAYTRILHKKVLIKRFKLTFIMNQNVPWQSDSWSRNSLPIFGTRKYIIMFTRVLYTCWARWIHSTHPTPFFKTRNINLKSTPMTTSWYLPVRCIFPVKAYTFIMCVLRAVLISCFVFLSYW
jgi:hypothetical protein